LPVLLATSLSFPPAAASSLDEALPLVGAVLARDTPEPDLVLGMHVVSGAELVASLTLGDGAKFRRVELGPRLVRLVAAPGAPEWSGALGVSGNYLLVATRVEALNDAGRFVAESVSKRARKEPGLELRTGERVLKGALSQTLRESWQARRAALVARAAQERQAKGREADFADPAVLLAGVDSTVEAFLGVLESSRELALSVVPEGDRLRAELSLAPGPEGAAALLAREIVTGSISPLLKLPSRTHAALLLRGEQEPQPGGATLAQSIAQLFGPRLSSEQATELTSALDALVRARRGATVIGWLTTPAPALLATFDAPDATAFSEAFAGALRLLELGPVRTWLAGTVGKPSLILTQSTPSNTGQARLRFLATDQSAGAPLPKSLTVTWEARDGVAYVAVAADAASGLASFKEPSRLADSSWLAQSQPELAAHTALALFFQTQLLAPGGPDDAPALLALGKRGDRIVVGLDLAPTSLGAVSRAFLR
jgi:hypothetical protein